MEILPRVHFELNIVAYITCNLRRLQVMYAPFENVKGCLLHLVQDAVPKRVKKTHLAAYQASSPAFENFSDFVRHLLQ